MFLSLSNCADLYFQHILCFFILFSHLTSMSLFSVPLHASSAVCHLSVALPLPGACILNVQLMRILRLFFILGFVSFLVCRNQCLSKSVVSVSSSSLKNKINIMRFSVTALALLATPAIAFHHNPAAPHNAPATALSVGSYLDALHETPTAPAAAAAQPAAPVAASNANAAASQPAAPAAPAAPLAASAQTPTFSSDLYSAIVQPAHPQETHALSMGQEFARARSSNGHVVGYESRKPAMYSGRVTNNAMLSALVEEVCDADGVNSEACQSAIAKYSEARAAWPGGMRQEFQRGRTAQGTVG